MEGAFSFMDWTCETDDHHHHDDDDDDDDDELGVVVTDEHHVEWWWCPYIILPVIGYSVIQLFIHSVIQSTSHSVIWGASYVPRHEWQPACGPVRAMLCRLCVLCRRRGGGCGGVQSRMACLLLFHPGSDLGRGWVSARRRLRLRTGRAMTLRRTRSRPHRLSGGRPSSRIRRCTTR